MARCRPRCRYHRALQRLARYRADAAWYYPRPDDLFLRSLGQPQRGVRWRVYPLSRSPDPGVDRGRNGQGHLLLPEGAQRPLSRRGDLRPRRGLQSLFDVIASGARNLLQMETPFHGDVSALDMTDWTANQNKKAEDRSPALLNGFNAFASGHERRPLLWMAAHRLPLFSVCDRSHAAVQNDAMGQTRSFDHLVGDGKQRRWDH